MTNKLFYKSFALILLFVVVSGVFFNTPLTAFASTAQNPYDVALSIIDWKKTDVGSTTDGYLINDKFLLQAGTTAGDWFPIGLGRLGIQDNQAGYLAVIDDYVYQKYQTSKKLDSVKATEWHRISLAVLAAGGNPRKMGLNGDIDLIADGTYNRVNSSGTGMLGRQGINGYIWGLIALDSLNYEVPQGAAYTRDDIILTLLQMQHGDGWWSMLPVQLNSYDVDITAMCVQALAPYYNSEKQYEVAGNMVKVRESIDKAVEWLSSKQNDDGSFTSWGAPNSEACVQVAVALCSLGIDIFTDSRFIKTGNTVYDGIMIFQNSDGGFIHSLKYDPENPSALPDKSNTMASEQTLYGMAAIHRYQNGMRRLYDFRAEQSDELKEQITMVKGLIDNASETTSKTELQGIYNAYQAIPASERSYVYNYYKLSALLQSAGIEYCQEEMDFNNGNDEEIVTMEVFTDVDMAKVDALPTNLTTEYKVEVLTLWAKIRNCFDFEGKQDYYIKLEKAKNAIDELQAQIDLLKADIKQHLYPFDSISLSDKKVVQDLYNRYMALSPYDQAQLEASDVEGLLKCKTQVENLQTALIISGVCVAVAGVATAIVIANVRKRKKEKASKLMQESDE